MCGFKLLLIQLILFHKRWAAHQPYVYVGVKSNWDLYNLLIFQFEHRGLAVHGLMALFLHSPRQTSGLRVDTLKRTHTGESFSASPASKMLKCSTRGPKCDSECQSCRKLCVFSIDTKSLTAAAHGWLSLSTSWMFLLHPSVVRPWHWVKSLM